MKLATSAPAAAPAPTEPISEPADEAGFGDFGGEESGTAAPESSDDKPFDDEPFDAGVEADEETDPKKYIEQLTGKLGQSLRKYTEEQGQPDFDLEKFVINSVLSATHTAEMDEEDRKDIIKKVNTAGDDDDSEDDNNNGGDSGDDSGNDSGNDNNDNSGSGDFDMGDNEEELQENKKSQAELDYPELYPDGWKEMDGLFLNNPKKNDMFQPHSNDKLDNSYLTVNEKNSTFDKNYLKSKLHESFNQEETMNEPMIEPQVKPAPTVVPSPDKVQPIAPSRKNKPFLPMPSVQPDPKANK